MVRDPVRQRARTGSGRTSLDQRAVELVVTHQSNSTKAEFIEELLVELRAEVSSLGISRAEAEQRLSRLEADSVEQQEILTRMQDALDERIESRRSLTNKISSLSRRSSEIDGLLARFDLLKEHYRVDLERLAAIEESGSLFVHLERKPCPLCGATPDNQHQGEQCDGDVESVIRAATAEIAKVNRLSLELNQTIADLQAESEELTTQRAQILPEYQSLNEEIQTLVSPLKAAQNTFGEIVRQSSELQRTIDKFNRIEDLESRRATFLAANANSANPPADPSTDNPQMDLSASVLDDFAKNIQQLLQDVEFPRFRTGPF